MRRLIMRKKISMVMTLLLVLSLIPASSKAATQATYTFRDFTYVSSYDLTYSVNSSGALTVNYQGQYKEIKYRLPGNIDLSNCTSIVINASSPLGRTAFKFYDTSGAEAFVQYNVQSSSAQNTTITLNSTQQGKTVNTIGVMSQDAANYSATVNSITFNVSSGGGGTSGDLRLAFNQMNYASHYGLTYSVSGAGVLTVNYQGQYREIKFNLRNSVNLANCTSIVVNASSSGGSAVKFYDTSGAEAFVQYNINGSARDYTIAMDATKRSKTIGSIGVMSLDAANYSATVNSITFKGVGSGSGGPNPTPTPTTSPGGGSGPLVALTFDDGPNTSTTVRMLDKLQQHGVVGTFFVIGNNVNSSTTSVLQRAYNMGCEIGNHSLTHSDMAGFNASQVTNEITTTNTRVRNAIGVTPRFFRPPYISTSSTLYSAANMPFIQGIMCNDWDAAYNTSYRAQTVLNQVRDGSIVLLHDFAGNQMTVDALDTIIPTLKNRGYRFVTVSQLFQLKGVTPRVGSGIYSQVP